MKNNFPLFGVIFLIFFFSWKDDCLFVNGRIGLDYKIALVMNDGPQDLGFNFQINLAKVNVERALKLNNFATFVTKDVKDLKGFIRNLCMEGYIGIIVAPMEYNTIAIEVASEFPIVQFLMRSDEPPAAQGNLQYATYNAPQTLYVIGYAAGLLTKNGRIGFIEPGAPFSKSYPGNAFFQGAYKAREDLHLSPPHCDSYSMGGWVNVELSTSATNYLLDSGVDVIGNLQNDLSSPLTAIQRGYVAFGSNSFPLGNIFGNKIAASFVFNWTECFLMFVSNVITYPDGVGYVPSNFNGDIANGFLTYERSKNIDPKLLVLLDIEISAAKTTPKGRSLFYCDFLISTLFNTTFVRGSMTSCIDPNIYMKMNDPYPGEMWNGNYTIPIILRDIPRSVTVGFSIAAGICIFLCIVLEFVIYFNRTKAVIRSASPIFCYLIIGGGIIVYVGLIFWAASPSPSYCNSRYWLVTLGYTILIGSLVVKNFRIWLIFDNPELKAIKITNYQLFPWIAALILINSLLMALVTSIGEMTIVKAYQIDDLSAYEYLEKCSMNNKGDMALYVLLGYFAVLLLVGVFVSWKIRIVDIAEFNESKPIANTLYAISFSLFVIVSLVVSPQSNLNQNIILGIAGLFITTASLAILFAPKVYSLINRPSNDSDQLFSKKKSLVANSRGHRDHGFSSVSHPTGMQANILAEFSDDSDISEIVEEEEIEEIPFDNNSKEEIILSSSIPPIIDPLQPTHVLAVFTDDSITEGNNDDDDDDNDEIVFKNDNNV